MTYVICFYGLLSFLCFVVLDLGIRHVLARRDLKLSPSLSLYMYIYIYIYTHIRSIHIVYSM